MKDPNLAQRGTRTGLRSAVVMLGVLALLGGARSVAASSCTRVVLAGEVNAGQVWRADLGQGWVFRVQPIAPGLVGHSGWDLVVDRDPPAGYPDALLLATLPYNSINEREIGTTFGLRAQDATGWNPRSFHFLVDPAAFREAQRLFLALAKDGRFSENLEKNESPDAGRLLQLQKDTAAGEFHIENVRLTPGIADAAPFAELWALAAMRTPHQSVPPSDGKPSPRGALLWMRFSLTLWLPAQWRLPPDLNGREAPCMR